MNRVLQYFDCSTKAENLDVLEGPQNAQTKTRRTKAFYWQRLDDIKDHRDILFLR